MPQSLASVTLHLVFSTKHRTPCLTKETRVELYAYAATVLKELGCSPIKLGGVADHLHILCGLSRTVTLAGLAEHVKTPTSRWLKSRGVAYSKFSWQNGYSVFSVSESNIGQVRSYIEGQEAHHCGPSFQDELRRLLDAHNIEYDERYIWD